MKTYIDNGETIIFENTWTPKDPANKSYQDFLEEIKNGVAELIPYVFTWEEIRGKRNTLLSESDWSIMEDANPKPSKQAWLDYRQALRDIPQNFTNPEDVIWPQKP